MSQNDDALGYGKPPKHSRFKAGVSGNPRGRPKASSLRDEIDAVLAETTALRGVEMSKGRAIAQALVAAAIDGNVRAATTLLALSKNNGGEVQDDTAEQLSGSALLDDYVEQEIARRASLSNKNDT